jgi:hypothetical protein
VRRRSLREVEREEDEGDGVDAHGRVDSDERVGDEILHESFIVRRDAGNGFVVRDLRPWSD